MLSLEKNHLTIRLIEQSNQPDSLFHYVWLRDNCSCTECIHPTNFERILITADIADDIAPAAAEVVSNKLKIRWNQNQHQSEYDLDWLQQHDYSRTRFNSDSATADSEIRLWDKKLQSEIPRFDYQEVQNSDSALLDWCLAIRDIGVTVLHGAPLEEGEIERFANRVAFVRETVYDRLHTVKNSPGEYNSYNVASTTLELKPHTDIPCYNSPPGVQMFHFLRNESKGGESTAVDGFYVAHQLKQDDPKAYEILSTTPIHYRIFSSRGDLQARNPMLMHDSEGNLKTLRFSNQVAQPSNLDADSMLAFYDAYRKLGRMIEAPENKVEFKLGSGDILATNNLRVLHGRNAYDPNTGDRHLQITYMDMDDVYSRIRMLRNAL